MHGGRLKKATMLRTQSSWYVNSLLRHSALLYVYYYRYQVPGTGLPVLAIVPG